MVTYFYFFKGIKYVELKPRWQTTIYKRFPSRGIQDLYIPLRMPRSNILTASKQNFNTRVPL